MPKLCFQTVVSTTHGRREEVAFSAVSPIVVEPVDMVRAEGDNLLRLASADKGVLNRCQASLVLVAEACLALGFAADSAPHRGPKPQRWAASADRDHNDASSHWSYSE